MSTSKPELTIEQALSGVSTDFLGRLLKAYRGLKSAFLKRDFDACGLRAGRFCEVLLRWAQDKVTGVHIPFGTRILNFDAEVAKLEQTQRSAGPESVRIVIPRALNFLYALRNKRGIGHEGGDVDANQIDAATAVRVADWCVAEVIRVTHTLSLEEAQVICDAVAERQMPEVWEVLGKKRVMNTKLNFADQTLILLHSHPDAVPVEDLVSWTEYSSASMYRRDVLGRLHKARLVEYDRETDMVVISPTGTGKVEDALLASVG